MRLGAYAAKESHAGLNGQVLQKQLCWVRGNYRVAIATWDSKTLST